MTPVKTAVHVRDNGSVTAAAEKRLLEAIARRLPAAINSDHLSALGLGAMAAAGAAFAALRVSRWAAAAVVVALAANWVGDSLDGTVARVRGQLRPRYGYYVDHVIDLAGATLLFAGIGCSGVMHPLLAALVLIGYLLVSAETYLMTHAAGVFRMSFLGMGPTELRLLLAVGAIKAAVTPFVTLGDWPPVRLFDVGGVAAMAGLVVAFVAGAVRNTRALYAAEPIPVRQVSRVA
ncbi:MAG TPA: CDP-alcohol phosphatidyltransferase family protein [Vicinamibacterales bacterium]|jgi:phosphatidylglycerophosphate synthase